MESADLRSKSSSLAKFRIEESFSVELLSLFRDVASVASLGLFYNQFKVFWHSLKMK